MYFLVYFSFFSYAQNDKNLNEKEFKGCDRSSNLSETKVDIRRDYTQTFSASEGNQTTLNGCASGGVPLAGAVPADYR